jgi:hypothetical protein
MKKSDLRKMVREVVEEELYRILPELISEAMDNILRKAGPRRIDESKEPARNRLPLDPSSLRAALGYGDFRPGMAGSVPVESEDRPSATIAGVPMEGGLAAKEKAAGQIPPGPAADVLADAIGKAKSVYDRAKEKTNWRPGKRQ